MKLVSVCVPPITSRMWWTCKRKFQKCITWFYMNFTLVYIKLNLLHEVFIYFIYIHGLNIFASHDFYMNFTLNLIFYMSLSWGKHLWQCFYINFTFRECILHLIYMSFTNISWLLHVLHVLLAPLLWILIQCFLFWFIHSQPDQCSWEYPLKTVHLDGCSLASCFWTRFQVGWARWQFYGSEEH